MSHRTHRKFWIAPAIGLALMLAVSLPAATYEVAQRHPQASDDAPGIREQPWKSITKAAQQARAGDVVVIRGGVYRERVLVKSSGTAQVPIRFEAAPGEHVVVTEWDGLDGLLHSIAFAPHEELAGDYLDSVSREAFAIAHDISSYSFAALARRARAR